MGSETSPVERGGHRVVITAAYQRGEQEEIGLTQGAGFGLWRATGSAVGLCHAGYCKPHVASSASLLGKDRKQARSKTLIHLFNGGVNRPTKARVQFFARKREGMRNRPHSIVEHDVRAGLRHLKPSRLTVRLQQRV